MINLLPPDKKEAIRYGRINTTILLYIILAVLTVVVLICVLFVGSAKLSKTEEDLNKEINLAKSQAEDLKEYQDQAIKISAEIKKVGGVLDREIKFSELIPSIGAIMPNGGILTQLNLTEDTSAPLSLTAKVDSEETAAVLRKNLEESEIFQTADIISITSLEGDAYKFQVSILVEFENMVDRNAPQEGDSI